MKLKKTLLTFLTTIVSFSLMALPVSALTAKTGATDQFKVELKSIPEKPAVNKDTTYLLKIINIKSNEPVQSATLKLSALMEQTGGHNMPGMGGESEGSQLESDFASTGKAGELQAKMDFNMEGNWQLRISGIADGKPLDIGLTDNVVQSATEGKPNWVVIGGFLAIIVATGVLFANKRRVKASETGKGNRLLPSDIPAEDEA